MGRHHFDEQMGLVEARQAPWWGVVLWGVSIAATLAVGLRVQAGEPGSAGVGAGLDWVEVVMVGALLMVLMMLKWVDRDFGLSLGRFSRRRGQGRALSKGAFTLSAFQDSLDPSERVEGVFREEPAALGLAAAATSPGARPRRGRDPVGGLIESREGVTSA